VVLWSFAVLYAVFVFRPSFEFRGRRWFTLFDDAMISMTYARNLSGGHGLVWNAGGPAVEGYTNFLWTLALAVCHLTGLPENLLPLLVGSLAAALLLACAALASAIARLLAPRSRAAPILAAVFVGLYYPLVYWALRGMEVGLVTFLVLAAVLLALRLRRGWSGRDMGLLGLVVAAGLLTRDDFAVPAAVLWIWLVAVLRGRARVVTAAALTAVGLAAAGGHVAFRLWYYGNAFPNAYYLKVVGQPAGLRLARGLESLLALTLADLAVLLGVVAAGAWIRRRVEGGAARLFALVAAYSVAVGGDAWEWARLANRMLVPGGAVLLILAATHVEPLAVRVRRAGRPWMALWAVAGTCAVFGLVDSWLGVLLVGFFDIDLGVIRTDAHAARVAAASLLGVLAAAWYFGGRWRLPGRLARACTLVPLLGAAVLVAATGNAWISWSRDGGFFTAQNRGATAYGLVLNEVTEPAARIAVVWAGAPVYYAHRAGVDLLGTTDPVIAHGARHQALPLYPGHDKFDFGYSIGKLRPDLIAQHAWFTAADIDHFVSEGYAPVRFRARVADDLARLEVPRRLMWLRGDSALVRRGAFEPLPLEEARTLSIELP
jgi:hypothetical protein